MKIALAQLNYHIGNFDNNLKVMLSAVEKAKAKKADLILFGELAVCGYPPRDFLEFNDFIQKSEQCIEELKEVSDSIAIVVGAPSVNPKIEGKDLFYGLAIDEDNQPELTQDRVKEWLGQLENEAAML